MALAIPSPDRQDRARCSLLFMYLWLVRSSCGTGGIPILFAQMAMQALPWLYTRSLYKAQHIAALLVPVWRVKEGGAAWLIKD